jgi:hypothetical protein
VRLQSSSLRMRSSSGPARRQVSTQSWAAEGAAGLGESGCWGIFVSRQASASGCWLRFVTRPRRDVNRTLTRAG